MDERHYGEPLYAAVLIAFLVGLIALGQLDLARLKEGPHPFDPGLAVDVLVVVANLVERHELLVVLFRPVLQELIEHLFPGRVVHLRGLGDHPVHVEQAGGDAVGQA